MTAKDKIVNKMTTRNWKYTDGHGFTRTRLSKSAKFHTSKFQKVLKQIMHIHIGLNLIRRMWRPQKREIGNLHSKIPGSSGTLYF
jgi:hypothetical protein